MSQSNETEAYIWWCGDEVCDCHQPWIVELVPNRRFPQLPTEKIIWRGVFHSGPGVEDLREMKAELLAECGRRGIPIPEEYAS